MRLRQIGNTWSERENEERERKGDREASFLSSAVTPKFACWLHHYSGRVLMGPLQPPFLVTVIKPDDLSSSSRFCKRLPCGSAIERKTESVPAPHACSEDESDL